MENILVALVIVAFIVFLTFRKEVTAKANAALNAAMKKWWKDSDGV